MRRSYGSFSELGAWPKITIISSHRRGGELASMSSTQIFRAPKAVFTPEHGEAQLGPVTLVAREGIITYLAAGDDAEIPAEFLPDGDAETIALPESQVLIPGLVDTHVHVNEPGRTEWEGFASATRAAAAGGVTTLIDMPLNSIPSTVTMDALDIKRAIAAEKAKVSVGFWGGVVPENLGTGELRALWETGGVFGFKCFLLHSGVDEFAPLNPQQLEQAMEEIAEFDGQLIVHAEDAELIEQGEAAQMQAGGITEVYATFEASRPNAAEFKAIAQVIDAAEKTGCRAHILHLSDSGSLEQIRQAQQRGVRITAETCPHYLSLFSEEIQDGATQFKCCPPIRTAGNRERLWAGLVDGVLGMVVSDHSPCTAELKKFQQLAVQEQQHEHAMNAAFSALVHEAETGGHNLGGQGADGRGHGGSFGEAWGGVASVQLGLPVVWSQARLRGLSLVDVVTWMSANPAAWAGLHDRGQLSVGKRADVVAIAADDAFVVLPEQLHHKNKVTAYAQRALAGVVHRSWVGGELVYQRPQEPLRAAELEAEQWDSTVFPAPVQPLIRRPQ